MTGDQGSAQTVAEPPRTARPDGFTRAGCRVRPGRSLGEVLHRRPAGVTANQWNSAIRTRVDFVVHDADTGAPAFVVEFDDPDGQAGASPRTARAYRTVGAVCEAVGLELLRIESAALRPAVHGRWIVEYLIDARGYAAGVGGDPLPDDGWTDPAPSYRDIVGRLPDGRTGPVNDLGAVARAAAVEAFVSRRTVDPIIRGLHVRWTDGPAEGWGWLQLRERRYLFERVRVWPYRFTCGIDLGQLAEDLAAAAIGERIRQLDAADPATRDGAELERALAQLRGRRDELESGFGYDHVRFDHRS
ncbi:MAG TPA: DUF2726 domain-containing protein [Pilimelia sp.]|nr:DUF2726 domain-containing protein [Pilimelia sp.]